jgi:hypothetical protein
MQPDGNPFRQAIRQGMPEPDCYLTDTLSIRQQQAGSKQTDGMNPSGESMNQPNLTPADIEAMLNDLGLSPDARMALERLLLVTLATMHPGPNSSPQANVDAATGNPDGVSREPSREGKHR